VPSQGKSGAAVGTFFRTLRWALVVNLFIAILWIAVVIIPVRFFLVEFSFADGYPGEFTGRLFLLIDFLVRWNR
jgi:hypothetical protein